MFYMKKTVFTLYFLAAICSLFSTCFAEEWGDYTYKILDDGTAQITKYTGQDTEIIVPKFISWNPLFYTKYK